MVPQPFGRDNPGERAMRVGEHCRIGDGDHPIGQVVNHEKGG